jgi:hypothetical protein
MTVFDKMTIGVLLRLRAAGDEVPRPICLHQNKWIKLARAWTDFRYYLLSV